MILPQNLPLPRLSCSSAAPTDRSADLTNNLLKHLQVFRTLHHAVLSPSFPAWELSSLNTSVRVCFAQPSHSGAECDPRHRGAVLHRKATTPKHHHSLDPHRQSPTPSPNQPIQWPPGPKTVPFEYIRFRISHACFSTCCHLILMP